jgi:hypothetical protein
MRDTYIHGRKNKKKICTWKSKVKEVGVYMFRRVGVSEQS